MTDGIFARHRHYRIHIRSNTQGVVRHRWASREHQLRYQIHPAWSFDRDGEKYVHQEASAYEIAVVLEGMVWVCP